VKSSPSRQTRNRAVAESLLVEVKPILARFWKTKQADGRLAVRFSAVRWRIYSRIRKLRNDTALRCSRRMVQNH